MADVDHGRTPPYRKTRLTASTGSATLTAVPTGPTRANTVPMPAGRKLPWLAVPPHVRTALAERLGAPVSAARDLPGGFSPGAAARLDLGDGRRVFVKAVSAGQNPRSPDLYRREAQVAAVLPTAARAPRLRAAYDDGDWVALAFDFVSGRHPRLPWTDDDLAVVLPALERLAGALTPAPNWAPPIAVEFSDDFAGWRRLASTPPDDLPSWAARHLTELADLEATWPAAVAGDTLLHLDLRGDNLLITADRQVIVIDWSAPCAGAAWADLVAFLLNPALHGGHHPEALLAGTALGRSAPPSGVTALVCAAAGYFAARSRQPAPPGLPTIRRFQRAQERVALDWLAVRTGWA